MCDSVRLGRAASVSMGRPGGVYFLTERQNLCRHATTESSSRPFMLIPMILPHLVCQGPAGLDGCPSHRSKMGTDAASTRKDEGTAVSTLGEA